MTRPALALLALALVSSPFFAQQLGGGPGMTLEQLYPGPLGTSLFGKVVAGEFTGGGGLDAVVMADGTPQLLVTPETFDTAIPVGGPKTDFAVLDGVVPGKDLVVTVGAGGLKTWERDYAAASWITSTVRGVGSAWQSARFVRVGDLDGTGGLDLVGVAASGTEVLIEHGDGNGDFTSGTGFSSFGGVIYGIELLDFAAETGGAPPLDEIALFTPYGVEIYETDGAYVDSLAWSLSEIQAEVVSDGVQATERLAMITACGSTEWFLLLDEGGTEGPYNLGAPGVVDMASGDADGDGDSELFLGIDSARAFLQIDGLGSAIPSYDLSFITTVPYGDPRRNPAINEAGLAPGDFDSDGSLDVLAPAQGDQGMLIVVYGTIELAAVGTGDPDPMKVGLTEVHYVEGTSPDPDALSFAFTDPATLLIPGPGETLELGISVWRTPDLGQATTPGTYAEGTMSLPLSDPYTLPLPAGYSLYTSTDVFSLVVRQVVRSGGDLVQQGPAEVILVTGVLNWPILQGDPTLNSHLPIQSLDTGVPPGGGASTGGTVPPGAGGSQPNGE